MIRALIPDPRFWMLDACYWMLDELKAQSLPAFGGLKAER
ncbi:hypothetical protein D3OALGB2SA_669 [Olavius algarvensis associated proteobacterium Delta 3]|nr:hypothetical protein D3OALGB2SA_669 [Olavius algarvensis associated proteobacterium Delta 3]